MLAIIIPYFKINNFEDTLLSLDNQTDKRFKVYIGDDASPDDPTVLINKFKDKFQIEYTKFETNLGGASLVYQWDRCIELAGTEPWLMILGDDDVLSNNVVEKFYENKKEIESNKISVIKYATIAIDETNKELGKNFIHNNKISNSVQLFSDKLNNKFRSSLSEYIFENKVYTENKFKNYPMAWHSDDMAWLEFSNFKNIFCINDSIVYIRFFQNCISGSKLYSIQKSNASHEFYRDLVSKYFYHFNTRDKIMILNRLENLQVKKGGKNKQVFIFIMQNYLKNRLFFSSINFVKRWMFYSYK